MYLLVDAYQDIHEVHNYKGLQNVLIDELVQDGLSNHTCYDDIKNVIRTFEKLLRNETGVIKELENRMWKVVDLEQLHRDIYDLNEYFNYNNEHKDSLERTLEIIERLIGGKNGI